MPRCLKLAAILAALLSLGFWQALADNKDKPAANADDVIAALEEFNILVGDWRGVGQPKRGSTQGAWQETAACVWQIKKSPVGLLWKAGDGKHWESALVGYDPDAKRYTVTLTLPDESTRGYAGTFAKERLTVESEPDKAGLVHRLTLSILNENRLTALFEQRTEKQTFYSRVAEIGFQRQGTKLAASDGNGPECVVTGGKGTIAVMHKGKTYFVCCTGCRDAFNEDPAGILAAYEAKKAKK